MPPGYSATVVARAANSESRRTEHLTVAGLFAGIGGIEEGLHRAGHSTELLCEIDPSAQKVLKANFDAVPLAKDVRELKSLPRVDVCAAGFPCQDLSQAGRTAGIKGANSGLVEEVFRLVKRRGASPTWLLLENVPFMLHLDRGEAMRHLTNSLADRGFAWAYRVVDTRAFGLPQRRQRVILVASKKEDPRDVVLVGDEGEPTWPDYGEVACGFYWTEGTRGLGWAIDAVPTLKGGSSLGIPSPPAVWMPDGEIVVTSIKDAERLQGFSPDWTLPAALTQGGRKGARWRLVGNAVTVHVARWIGERLANPGGFGQNGKRLEPGRTWPQAAYGHRHHVYEVDLSPWPVREPHQDLADFLERPLTPLSKRAAAGFLARARTSTLNFPAGFLAGVAGHLDRMTAETAAA